MDKCIKKKKSSQFTCYANLRRSNLSMRHTPNEKTACSGASSSPAKAKPTLEEVLAYADAQAQYYIREQAQHLPDEQKDEIAQDVKIRILSRYHEIDSERGWKALVQRHCFGAVKDYTRRGRGFQESKWAYMALKTGDTLIPRFREDGPQSDDGHSRSVDEVLGYQPAPDEEQGFDSVNIKEDLLARLCSADHDLHLFVRHHILGQTLTELAKATNLKRSMIKNRVSGFMVSLTEHATADNPWVNQTLYALGICAQFDIPEEDYLVGWNLKPVDFESKKIRIDKIVNEQMSLFDLE